MDFREVNIKYVDNLKPATFENSIFFPVKYANVVVFGNSFIDVPSAF